MSRNAVITGSGNGIGAAIALRLAKEGINVVLNDLESQEQSLKESVASINALGGGNAVYVAGDACDPRIVQAMIDKCVDSWGSLDIVSLD
jgi:meso-butanediol dehydrogenase / (S,S)-butanediol dehydrogenase / diacetyl reductase